MKKFLIPILICIWCGHGSAQINDSLFFKNGQWQEKISNLTAVAYKNSWGHFKMATHCTWIIVKYDSDDMPHYFWPYGGGIRIIAYKQKDNWVWTKYGGADSVEIKQKL